MSTLYTLCTFVTDLKTSKPHRCLATWSRDMSTLHHIHSTHLESRQVGDSLDSSWVCVLTKIKKIQFLKLSVKQYQTQRRSICKLCSNGGGKRFLVKTMKKTVVLTNSVAWVAKSCHGVECHVGWHTGQVWKGPLGLVNWSHCSMVVSQPFRSGFCMGLTVHRQRNQLSHWQQGWVVLFILYGDKLIREQPGPLHKQEASLSHSPYHDNIMMSIITVQKHKMIYRCTSPQPILPSSVWKCLPMEQKGLGSRPIVILLGFSLVRSFVI